MSQNAIPVFSQYAGGNKSALNVTAIAQIKPAVGTLYRILPIAVGSSGSLIISDVASTTSATASYTIGQAVFSSGTLYFCILGTTGNAPPNATYWSTTPPAASIVYQGAYNALTAGLPLNLEWPFQNGILVSQVPAGSPVYSLSFF